MDKQDLKRTPKEPCKGGAKKKQKTTRRPTLYEERQMLALKIKCRICKEIIDNTTNMEEHIIKMHGNQQVSMPKKHIDKVVKQKLLGEVSVGDTLADFEISRLSIAVRHCPTCDKYVEEMGILAHLTQHRRVAGIPFEYPCEECGEIFCNKQSRTRHKRKKHQDVKLDPVTKVPKMKKEKQCQVCGKTFLRANQLNQHLGVHMTIKPYQCKVCNKGFARSNTLDSHMRVHTGVKPYVCDICQEAYRHNVSLKMHKKKIHGVDWWQNNNPESTGDESTSSMI